MHLVIGSNGLIGTALRTLFDAEGAPYLATSRLLTSERLALDLAADPQDWRLPRGVTTAFLCAAETKLDACDTEPLRTASINVSRTADLAGQLVSRGAFVVYPSSNLVFDGSRAIYRPDDPLTPLTEYGRQKAAAEEKLAGLGEGVAIVRLTKVLHPGMGLFRDWKASLLRGEVIRPFGNLFISPLSPAFVARALRAIAERKLSGITQLSGDRQISYADCAWALAEGLGCNSRLVQPAEAVLGKARSAVLDAERASRELGLPPPNVADTLAELFHSLP